MSASPALVGWEGRKYLNLETYRKNGLGVRTPVWFAYEKGTFYVYSLAEAGKIKRIRNNPAVRIAPCGAFGAVQGDWCAAQALLLDDRNALAAHRLLDRKYGWMKRLGGLKSRLLGQKYAVIEIKIAAKAV